MKWDPQVYERFRAEREQPFLDLVAALPECEFRTIVDAGCGTGRTTRLLSERWPEASVVGVDASAQMMAEACGPVVFIQADIRAWRPATAADLVIANAVLHWLPEPENVLEHLASWITDSGTLALQMPANHDAPAYRAVRAIASSPPWEARLANVAWGDNVLTLDGYRKVLDALGLDVEAWDVTYEHVLPNSDAIIDWLAGTTLRPVFAALPEIDATRFVEELRGRIRAAYPPAAEGTRFPFRRRFVVAGGAVAET